MSHLLKKTSSAGPQAPQWPSYTGVSQFVGNSSSGRVSVYVDPTLGQPALQNAQDLVNDADRVVNANDSVFGSPGGPVSVIIFALDGATDGTGGADHMGCDYTTGAAIEVCASFGNSARVSALFEAELSECSMGGNLCGASTGEGLSRWCAAVIGNNALSDFATAPTWVQDGMPDFVTTTDPTDRNPDSTGCAMAFLSWLMSQGFSLNQIAPKMVSLGDTGTLAQLYTILTGNPAIDALPKFIAAVQALPGGVTSDDPFGGSSHLAHVALGRPCETKSHRLRLRGQTNENSPVIKVNAAEWSALSADHQARIKTIIASFYKGARIVPDAATAKGVQYHAAAFSNPFCKAACNVAQAAATAACAALGNPIAIAACIALAEAAGDECRSHC